MISIYHELDTGIPGEYYGSSLGWSSVKINIDEEHGKKTLDVRRGYGSSVESFNLDGWTGRYGMPIDFLLSIHLATMMPDLAYDMVESFDTQIVMLLHNSGSYLGGTASYDPYIAYVKDHWYRDIYFVQSDKEFVDYDYEYESVMKERWTLYETYGSENPEKEGEYKLYKIDDNGNYLDLYNGTKEEAEKKGIKVAKKAKTLNYNDEEDFEEINWHKNSFGKWTAYENVNGMINQTGEGLRTETNPEIKKMFLKNRYFRYDGSAETAEIITALRKNINSSTNYYGPVKGTDSNGNKVDYSDVSAVVGKEKYKVEDYSGEVSLNQDSLNAFSMLENEHTLDADYIYRDFKELIVELGYFKKEELTDETPRIMEFIVPKISSYGYPIRNLDKRENEYGTMAHSKYDYKKVELQDFSNQTFEKDGVDEDENGNTLEVSAVNNKNVLKANEINKLASTNLTATASSNSNINSTVGGISDLPGMKDFDDAGWSDTKAIVEQWIDKLNINTIGNYYSKGNNEEYEKFLTNDLGGIFAKYAGKDKLGDGSGQALQDAGEYCYGLMGMLGFNYCAYTGGADYDFTRCTPLRGYGNFLMYDAYGNNGKMDPHHDHEGPAPKLIDDCMVRQIFTTCCNYTTDKIYYKAGLIGGEGQPGISTCHGGTVNMVKNFGATPVFEICDLHFGDLIECYDYNGNNSTNPDDWTGWGHVMYVGEETEDTVTIYFTGHDYTNNASWRCEIKKDSPRSAMPAASGWVGIHMWDLDYTKKYEGYLGNEEVVSPVTGVLLEYGTYKDEKDSITNEEYRENVDYKYGTDSLLTNSENIDETQNAKNEEPQAKSSEDIPKDKVGYAKILVLDKENYAKLEKASNSKWKSDSLLTKSGNFKDKLENEDDMKNWSDTDKSIYGYKEFAELYDEYGISGYIVYIDGFKCSLSGTLSDGIVKDDKPLTFNSFKKVKLSNIDLDSEDQLDSEYEKDEEYNLPSKKATEKLNAEREVKDVASSSIYDEKHKLVFIKEGTVLGRTLTDKELLEDSKYRNKKFGTYKEIREDPDSEVSVIGNYLRVIMRDLDGTVVENVEDYMKLDTPEKKKKDDEVSKQSYVASPGDDIILANMMHREGCTNGFQSPAYGSYSKNEADRINMMTGYVLINRAIVNFEGHGTTIVDQLKAPGQYATAYVTNSTNIECLDCYANAKLCLKYDCSYVKNPKGVPMTKDVLFQSGWCQGDSPTPGKNCFWWVDDNKNGIPEEASGPGSRYDEFFCYSAKYSSYRDT